MLMFGRDKKDTHPIKILIEMDLEGHTKTKVSFPPEESGQQAGHIASILGKLIHVIVNGGFTHIFQQAVADAGSRLGSESISKGVFLVLNATGKKSVEKSGPVVPPGQVFPMGQQGRSMP